MSTARMDARSPKPGEPGYMDAKGPDAGGGAERMEPVGWCASDDLAAVMADETPVVHLWKYGEGDDVPICSGPQILAAIEAVRADVTHRCPPGFSAYEGGERDAGTFERGFDAALDALRARLGLEP